MNYIYDIILNFNKNIIYEFYEWKDEDNPEFIVKIPLFKIDDQSYLNIKNNDIIVDKKFLNQIMDKTESYSQNLIEIIRYACLFATEKSVFAIEFDSDGNNYMKSILSLDEESEVLEISKNIKYSIIEYKIKNKNKIINKNCTRKEKEREKNMIKMIDFIIKNKEYSKLKYIFYELYNEKLDDTKKIYNKIINVVKNNDNKTENLYEILELIENKKIMSNNS